MAVRTLLHRSALHRAQGPFAEAHLVDEDISIDFSDVTIPNDRVAIIATQPLTDNEHWTRIPPNELLVFVDAEPAH